MAPLEGTKPPGSNNHAHRRRLLVRGVVQGVGFRPYVFRLAQQYSLGGFVKNTSGGAVIEVEGPESAIEEFLQALPHRGPALMRVASVEVIAISPAEEQGFTILESESSDNALAWVPPDISVCEACIAEMTAPADRRYEYPFINCTNCGPRYSIILDVPYDRAQTTMAGFVMCDACRAEYDNPNDRRFHAQPIACPVCGPHLWLTGACGKDLPLRGSRIVLEATVNLLRSGGIAAWKGLGGYQLVCDARNENATEQLRRRKHRNEKSFAVMVHDAVTAEMFCELSEEEKDAAHSP